MLVPNDNKKKNVLQVGAKRCYDLQEVTCLLPQLGSGPYSNNSGSGYLSRQQYQRLLATANRLHIEVIPEIEMPGHARAAIKAMEARYRYTRCNCCVGSGFVAQVTESTLTTIHDEKEEKIFFTVSL